jgi:hypothetical protein
MNEKHTPEQIIRKLRQAETELAAQRVGLPDPSAVRSGRGLDGKVENAGKTEELESVLTLS